MRDKICPVCSGNSIAESKIDEIIEEPFGGQKVVSLNIYTCESCGSTGDFFNENEASIRNGISELKNDAIANILEDFSENKISLSSMERALELPQRTLTKWKNRASNPSSTGIALLKFLRVFPWLLEVAENKYDYASAKRIHMTVAFKEMLKHMNFDEDVFPGTEMGATANSAFLFVRVENRITDLVSENGMHQESPVPEITVSYQGSTE